MEGLHELATLLVDLSVWEIVGLVVLAGVILAGMDVRHRAKKGGKSDGRQA